jgi:hypothetical protein
MFYGAPADIIPPSSPEVRPSFEFDKTPTWTRQRQEAGARRHVRERLEVRRPPPFPAPENIITLLFVILTY